MNICYFPQDTYANWNAKRIAGSLPKGKWIRIIDRADLGIDIFCTENDEFSFPGNGGFLNPDFQSVGIYTSVATLTGISYTSTAGVWYAAGETGWSTGMVVFWNGLHYQVIAAGSFNGTNPATNTTAYMVLPKNSNALTYGYIEEWDATEFDFMNDWIQYRADRRGNVYGYSKQTDLHYPIMVGKVIHYGLGYTAINDFQWGRNDCYGNNINQGILNSINTPGKIYANTLGLLAMITLNILDPTASIYNNSLGASAAIKSNTMGASASIFANVLEAGKSPLSIGAAIHSNIFNSNANINTNSLGSTANISINSLDTGTTIENNVVSSGSSIVANTISSSIIAQNILFPNAIIHSCAINSVFLFNQISYTIGNKTFNGAFEFNVIANGFNEMETFSTVQYKRTENGFSNFECTIDITGLSVLDITFAFQLYCGIINITSSNATETISGILHIPTSFPFTLRPAAGLTLTLTGTAAGSAVAGDIVLPTTNVVLNGTNGDWLQLQQDAGGVGYSVQIDGQNYI